MFANIASLDPRDNDESLSKYDFDDLDFNLISKSRKKALNQYRKGYQRSVVKGEVILARKREREINLIHSIGQVLTLWTGKFIEKLI